MSNSDVFYVPQIVTTIVLYVFMKHNFTQVRFEETNVRVAETVQIHTVDHLLTAGKV